MVSVSKSSLSPAWRRLVNNILDIGYGSIDGLEIRDGQPVFDPPPRLTRLHVFGRGDGPHAKRRLSDFVLNDQFRWLIGKLGSGTKHVPTITIQDGLPIRIEEEAGNEY